MLEQQNVTSQADSPANPSNGLKTITAIVYALQAASFFIGIGFVAAVILNYVKQDDVRGTWLASHFHWQIRTFWFGLLWSIIGFVGLLWSIIGLVGLLVFIGYAILLANAIWIIYRIIKGWLRLSEGRAMYPEQR